MIERSHGYPRPQLERREWTSLNGPWDFALDRHTRWRNPAEVDWTDRIEVPFSPETAASGIGDTGFYRACWYRRVFEPPPLKNGDRLLLHFGAVDYAARVWINGSPAARHEGGYTPFSVDLTPFLDAEGPQTIVVRAQDEPGDLAKPRGKQDWKLEPHGIWYPRTTGIWQTVWLERVPRDLDPAGSLDAQPGTVGDRPGGLARRLPPRRFLALRQAARRQETAFGRQLPGDRGRGPSEDRPLRPGNRRLPQRAALEPRLPPPDRGAAASSGRAAESSSTRHAATLRSARSRRRGTASS